MASQLVTRGLGRDSDTVNEVTGGLGGFVSGVSGVGGMKLGMDAWRMLWRFFIRHSL